MNELESETIQRKRRESKRRYDKMNQAESRVERNCME